MGKKTAYKFKNQEYPLKGNLINSPLGELQAIFTSFINEGKFSKGQYLSIITQAKYGYNNHFTLGHRFPIDPLSDKDIRDYIDYFVNKYGQLANWYKDVQVYSIYFNYTLISESDYNKGLSYIKSVDSKVIRSLDINPLGLPKNTNYEEWGLTVEKVSGRTTIIKDLLVDIGTDLDRYIEVTYLNSNIINVQVYSNISGIVMSHFTDRIKSPNEFTRKVGNRVYHINDSSVFFLYQDKYSNEYITPLKTQRGYAFDAITLDIETYLEDGSAVK